MRKGMAEETTMRIVLAIVVLLGLVAFFIVSMRRGTGIWDQIIELLGLDTYEEELERDLLKDAIKCSYYRCEKGCDEIDDDDFWRVNCKSDYCDSRWQDSNGKICGFYALQYPVEVELEEEITITEEGFIISGREPFITSDKDCKSGFIFDRGKPWLWVSEGLIKDNDPDFCKKGSCQMTSGYYYVSTKPLPPSINYGTTLCDFAKYKIISYDREETLTFEDSQKNKNYRIVAEGPRGNIEISLSFGGRKGPRPALDFSVGCKLSVEESEEIHIGNEKRFCDGNVIIRFIELGRKYIKIGIEVKDPKCHGINPDDTPDCGLCRACELGATGKVNMCCYPGEDCIDGVCENYQVPETCGNGEYEPEKGEECDYAFAGEYPLERGSKFSCDGNLLVECNEECKYGSGFCDTRCGSDMWCYGKVPGDDCYKGEDYQCRDDCQCTGGPETNIVADIEDDLSGQDWDKIIKGQNYVFKAFIHTQDMSNIEDVKNKWLIDGELNKEETMDISATTSTFESETWEATLGSHTVQLILDVDDKIDEGTDGEEDNIIERTFVVSEARECSIPGDCFDSGFCDEVCYPDPFSICECEGGRCKVECYCDEINSCSDYGTNQASCQLDNCEVAEGTSCSWSFGTCGE